MTYKVLLADDEKIIVQGIASVVNWEALDTELISTARNGIEAYEQIAALQPDIVISDIKMPGMDGITLVTKVHQEFPEVKFILLSGYSEFEYARTAMHYGVKNYLLKPCNEDKITAAIQEIIQELEEKRAGEHFVSSLSAKYAKAQPFIKAHLLTEFLTSKSYSNKDMFFYRQLSDFGISDQQVRLLLVKLEGSFSYEHLFAVQNIGSEILDSVLLSTNTGDNALFLIEACDEPERLQLKIEQIREVIFQYYKRDTTVAVSGPEHIRHARKLYREAMECLEHRFYLGEGSIITQKDILPVNTAVSHDFIVDEQQIVLKIKSGLLQDVREEIASTFAKMADLRLGISLTRSHCIRLYIAIVQTVDSDYMQDYLMGTSALLNMETVQQMKEYIETAAIKMTDEYYSRFKSKHSSVIARVIEVLNEHLSNPELSLKMVAADLMYMNPDYLGKLFKQETGQRFSAYLTRMRIEKAVEYINATDDVKVGTLAKITGFGDNPQYFSQVFKKQTGYTPSEYRKMS